MKSFNLLFRKSFTVDCKSIIKIFQGAHIRRVKTLDVSMRRTRRARCINNALKRVGKACNQWTQGAKIRSISKVSKL